MSVHTKQLGTGHSLATGFHVLFTVPSDFTVIVKSAVLANESGGLQDLDLWFGPSGSETRIKHWAGVPAGTSVEWDGWVALQPADTIGVTVATTSGLYVIVSGAQLDGTPP